MPTYVHGDVLVFRDIRFHRLIKSKWENSKCEKLCEQAKSRHFKRHKIIDSKLLNSGVYDAEHCKISVFV